jgi:hypothetical protein
MAPHVHRVSRYTKGGFVDECGVPHSSGHAFTWKVWEVLNEVDYGSPMQCPSPLLPSCAANYTRVYVRPSVRVRLSTCWSSHHFRCSLYNASVELCDVPSDSA